MRILIIININKVSSTLATRSYPPLATDCTIFMIKHNLIRIKLFLFSSNRGSGVLWGGVVTIAVGGLLLLVAITQQKHPAICVVCASSHHLSSRV